MIKSIPLMNEAARHFNVLDIVSSILSVIPASISVIPAQAGIQTIQLDPRLRGGDNRGAWGGTQNARMTGISPKGKGYKSVKS